MRLFTLLAGNLQYSVREICQQIGISPRTFYRYIALFRSQDFEVSEEHGIYSVDFSSAIFNHLTEKMRFTHSEVQALCTLLERADPSDSGVQRLRQRMRTLYGVEFDPTGAHTSPLLHENTDALSQAIAKHRQVMLHDYDSPHSHTTSNRLVEPFRLLPQQQSVRCYEIQSQQCKTFKIARMKSHIEILDQHWQWRGRHINYYTDLFGFSGEETHHIVLRLGSLATRILMEEYGVQDTQLVIDTDGSHRLFATSVCSNDGVGRFVLGLISDIDIVKGHNLQQWLHRQLQAAQQKDQPKPIRKTPTRQH